jgi:hypothetical protein
MGLLAVVKNPVSIARYLAAAGELTDVPDRSPPRTPPYWKSQVLRRQALGDEGDGGAWPRATAGTTAEATRQRKKRRRKRGLHRTRAKPASREGLARRKPLGGPSEAAPGARLPAAEMPPRRAKTARGRGD